MSFRGVITLSVTVAGVLIVFTFLVVPTAIAFLFTRNLLYLAAISWGGQRSRRGIRASPLLLV